MKAVYTLIVSTLAVVAVHGGISCYNSVDDYTYDSQACAMMKIFQNVDVSDSSDLANWGNGANLCDWGVSKLTCSGDNVIFPDLDVLSLSGCLNFTVPWPSTITTLRLDENDFCGQMDLSLLPASIQKFEVQMNVLNGSIDFTQLAVYSSLSYFYINDNAMTGCVDLTNLPSSVTRLYLHDNLFDCTTGLDVSNLPSKLTRLQIDNNYLSGSVTWPSHGTLPATIGRFYINDNQLSGFVNLSVLNIGTVKVENNNFTSINLDEMNSKNRILYGGNNAFQTTIDPSQWVTDITQFRFSNNYLYGSVDMTILPSELQYFHVAYNNLSGTIDLTNLTSNIKEMDLSNNYFEGTLDLTQLPDATLDNLLLANNSFSGTIDLGSLPAGKILELDLRGNNITGPVDFRNLTEFNPLIVIKMDKSVYCDPWIYCGDGEAYDRTNDTCKGKAAYGYVACEDTCVCRPTAAPTQAPTLVPTDAPTLVPTDVPSFSPTFVPTSTPTAVPTNSPTLAPTLEPTFSPSRVPSNSPTHVPTFAPVDNPTLAPTDAPTNVPTTSPTAVPSLAPTKAPTAAPTTIRKPESSGDEELAPSFYMMNMGSVTSQFASDWYQANASCHKQFGSNAHLATIERASQNQIIIQLLKDAYEENTANENLTCWVGLNDIFEEGNYKWQSNATSTCSFWNEGADQPRTGDDYVSYDCARVDRFGWYTQPCNEPLQCWFCDNPNRTYSSKDPCLVENNTSVLDALYDVVTDGILLTILIFLFLIIVLTLLGVLHKRESIRFGAYADDANTLALLAFGLQVWDFYSDAYFAYSLRDAGTEYFGPSLIFLFVPWLANLAFLLRMRLKWLERDDGQLAHVNAWVREKASILAFLTMIAGGANAAINLCNSRLFGLDFFDMGLPKRYIFTYSVWRILLTTMAENIPQIAIQVAYWFKQTPSASAFMAFLSSVASMCVIVITAAMETFDPGTDREFAMAVDIEFTEVNMADRQLKMREVRNKFGKRAQLAKIIEHSVHGLDHGTITVESVDFSGYKESRAILQLSVTDRYVTDKKFNDNQATESIKLAFSGVLGAEILSVNTEQLIEGAAIVGDNADNLPRDGGIVIGANDDVFHNVEAEEDRDKGPGDDYYTDAAGGLHHMGELGAAAPEQPGAAVAVGEGDGEGGRLLDNHVMRSDQQDTDESSSGDDAPGAYEVAPSAQEAEKFMKLPSRSGEIPRPAVQMGKVGREDKEREAFLGNGGGGNLVKVEKPPS